MTINATVTGIRLWPSKEGSRREVTLEWKEERRDWSYSFQLDDDQAEFQLGDQVTIQLTKVS